MVVGLPLPAALSGSTVQRLIMHLLTAPELESLPVQLQAVGYMDSAPPPLETRAHLLSTLYARLSCGTAHMSATTAMVAIDALAVGNKGKIALLSVEVYMLWRAAPMTVQALGALLMRGGPNSGFVATSTFQEVLTWVTSRGGLPPGAETVCVQYLCCAGDAELARKWIASLQFTAHADTWDHIACGMRLALHEFYPRSFPIVAQLVELMPSDYASHMRSICHAAGALAAASGELEQIFALATQIGNRLRCDKAFVERVLSMGAQGLFISRCPVAFL